MDYYHMTVEHQIAVLRQRESELERELFLLTVQDVELNALVKAGFNKEDNDAQKNINQSAEMVRAAGIRLMAVRRMQKELQTNDAKDVQADKS